MNTKHPISSELWRNANIEKKDRVDSSEVLQWKRMVKNIREQVPPKYESNDNHFLNLYSDEKWPTDCDANYCGRMCKVEDLTTVSELGLTMCFDSWQRFLDIVDEAEYE